MELKLARSITVADLASLIDAEFIPIDNDLSQQQITHIAKLEAAAFGSVSFLSNQHYKQFLGSTNASAVLVDATDASACPKNCAALISSNPRLSLAKLLQLAVTTQQDSCTGVHKTAVLGKNVTLGENVSIGANCVIGDHCQIGANTVLLPNVTLYAHVKIGKNSCIHSGSVIGSDGFGYAVDANGDWVKMPHLSGVVVGDFVEIGSNTSVDRGMIDDTVIGNRVIIDNQVQIGHNVVIGDNTAIAGCVGIAGSTHIGKYCLIGGASSITGHIIICDRVHLTATSSVSNSITKPGVYSSGMPVRENNVWRRNVARFMSLDSLAKRVRELEKRYVDS